MKALVAWICVVAVGAGVGGSLAWTKRAEFAASAAAAAAAPEPATAVASVVARRGEWAPRAAAIGTVVALRSVEVRAEVAGVVERVGFVSGGMVATGQTLVALDARAERAALDAAEAEERLAQLTLQRREGLRGGAAFSGEAFDAAREALAGAAARSEALRIAIDRKTIRAPFDGRIGITDLQPGGYLEAGALVGSIEGVDPDAFVDFALPQNAGVGLGVGAVLEIVSPALGAPVTATIEAVDEAVDQASRDLRFRARVEGGGARLRPGMFVDVSVETGAPRPIVLAPRTALRRSAAGAHVFVLEEAGGALRARARPVEIGATLGDEVVIEAGLGAGERIAAAGSFKLSDGALVVAGDGGV